MRITITLAIALALGACGGAGEVAGPATPVSYDQVSIADLDSAEKLTARCEEDEAAFRQRAAELEAFTGEPTVENFYRPLDALSSSAFTLQFHVSSLSGVHRKQSSRVWLVQPSCLSGNL